MMATTPKRCGVMLVLSCACMACLSAPAWAASTSPQLTATPAGGFGSYSSNTDPFLGTFPITLTVDGLKGPAEDAGTNTYWLGQQGVTSGTSQFLIWELSDVFRIDEIHLTNTHNRTSNDRDTNAFTIAASTDDLLTGATFSDVFSDNLTDLTSHAPGPHTTDIFSAANGDFSAFNARFIRFTPTSSHASQGFGLNEFEVFGVIPPEVPEPASIVLFGLAIAAMLFIASRQRRRRPAACHAVV